MSNLQSPPKPAKPQQNPQPRLRPLYKQKSWSPDFQREERWLRRKFYHRSGQLLRSSKSVTDEDLDDLKGCIELGFGFEPDSPELYPKLSEVLPAIELYCAVNKQYDNHASLSRSGSSSSMVSDSDNVNSGSPVFALGDDPETVKARLKQWARVVACSVRQLSGEPIRG